MIDIPTVCAIWQLQRVQVVLLDHFYKILFRILIKNTSTSFAGLTAFSPDVLCAVFKYVIDSLPSAEYIFSIRTFYNHMLYLRRIKVFYIEYECICECCCVRR